MCCFPWCLILCSTIKSLFIIAILPINPPIERRAVIGSVRLDQLVRNPSCYLFLFPVCLCLNHFPPSAYNTWFYRLKRTCHTNSGVSESCWPYMLLTPSTRASKVRQRFLHTFRQCEIFSKIQLTGNLFGRFSFVCTSFMTLCWLAECNACRSVNLNPTCYSINIY